jgi:hypothetical protein
MRALLGIVWFSLAAAACAPAAPPPQAHEAGVTQVDADFALRLGLLEGHLMVGRQLLEAGRKDDALPHFGHPIHELYGDLRPVIAARHLEQFDRDLVTAEAEAAARGDTPAFQASLQSALAKVVTARRSIPQQEWSSDDFTLRLIADVTTAASEEYRNAIVGGAIGSLVEYEDARGFVLYADSVLAAHSSTNPEIAQARVLVGELKAFITPLLPSGAPLATDAQFEEKAEALRALLKA